MPESAPDFPIGTAMPTVAANGLKLAYETFGNPAHPPLLLIMGLGAQMILWPEDLCERLAAGGYHVVRFDNRDIGLSDKLDHLGRPRLMRAGLAHTLRLPLSAPYRLDDMARDTIGLMDALNLASAHVVGLSMGGMIAQLVAALAPQRVRTLTLMMTSSGNRRLPGPSLKLQLRLVRRPEGSDREALIRHAMQTWQIIGSPAYPPEPADLRRKMERHHDRSFHPRGIARQTLAIMASPSRVPLLKKIVAPTLVIHGDADPLVPVAAGRELARVIPGARLEIVPGMGHDLPTPLLPRFAGLILDHLETGARRAA